MREGGDVRDSPPSRTNPGSAIGLAVGNLATFTQAQVFNARKMIVFSVSKFETETFGEGQLGFFYAGHLGLRVRYSLLYVFLRFTKFYCKFSAVRVHLPVHVYL